MSDSSATPGTIASQAPLSMEFSRQEYWSGLPFPSPKAKQSNALKKKKKMTFLGMKYRVLTWDFMQILMNGGHEKLFLFVSTLLIKTECFVSPNAFSVRSY